MNISVIIPVKNRAGLIGKTIQNLLQQTILPSEIIVVNDGSEDELEQALLPFKGKIILVNSNGTGPGAARNTGLGLATGQAIQFFDSDDLMTPNKLQTQLDLLLNQQSDFVYGPYVKAIEKDNTWQQTGNIMQYYPLPPASLAKQVMEGWCLLTQCVLFKAEFLRKIGPWRTDLMPHEDWEYWSRIALANPKYTHENKTCVIYRQHGDQITDKGVFSASRMRDGIKASEIIGKSLGSTSPAHSKIISRGHRAYLRQQLTPDDIAGEISNNFADKLAVIYFQFWSRIERFRSGNKWFRFHGAETSPEVFERYLELFQHKN